MKHVWYWLRMIAVSAVGVAIYRRCGLGLTVCYGIALILMIWQTYIDAGELEP